jgi:hypothetical protein
MASKAQSGRDSQARNGFVVLETYMPNAANRRRIGAISDQSPESVAEMPNETATDFALA